MLLATFEKANRKPIKFHGICAFAKAQKVDRVHAYRVLTGRRESRRLLAAWEAFKTEREGAL